MLCRPDRARRLAIGLVILGLLALPTTAPAAKLIGGSEQAAVSKAFAKLKGQAGETIVSIRASTVTPSWVVVKSVKAQRGDSSRAPRVRTTFLHHAGNRFRAASPPRRARADLSAPFEVAMVYSGSGSEAVHYKQTYRTTCIGGGGFVDKQNATVTPMSWSVRYLIEPDRLQAAVRTAAGVAIVPTVAFDSSASVLSASEKVTRTYVDNGCFDTPTTVTCTSAFHLLTKGADSDLSFDPGVGTEIGIPMRATNKGKCDPDNFTIGPSLWDEGASVAAVGKLDLIGGRLPANPYGRVRVSWPGSSALKQQDFLTSPCQGIASVCTDSLRWRGTVQLQAGTP